MTSGRILPDESWPTLGKLYCVHRVVHDAEFRARYLQTVDGLLGYMAEPKMAEDQFDHYSKRHRRMIFRAERIAQEFPGFFQAEGLLDDLSKWRHWWHVGSYLLKRHLNAEQEATLMNWIRGLQVNYSKLKSLFLKYVPAIEKHERFVKISGDVRKRLNAVAQFKAEQNRQYWKKVGLERRRREPAVSSDLQLAHYIAKHCEQHAREFLASANTIRQRLPELGLSAREWRKRRKVVNTSRTKTRAKK